MRSKTKRRKTREERKIKELQTLNVISFISILTIFLVGSIVLPKKTVSENEKRELTKFPTFSVESFISGKYFAQIDSFYNDTFPLRDEFLNLASYIDEIKGLREGEDEIKIYNVKN